MVSNNRYHKIPPNKFRFECLQSYSNKYRNNYILEFESVGPNKILCGVSHGDNNVEHLTDNLSTYIGNPIIFTCQANNLNEIDQKEKFK